MRCDLLRAQPRRYRHVDAAQRVRHAVGLATKGNRSGPLPGLVFKPAQCRRDGSPAIVCRYGT